MRLTGRRADGKAISLRKGDVEQEKVEGGLRQKRGRLVLAGGRGNLVAFRLEKLAQGSHDERVIFHDENLHGASLPS